MSNSEKPAGLYVHIPFCKKLCLYCDFYSRPAQAGEIDKYIEAVGCEAKQRIDFASSRFNSVFLGGGTPSLLTPSQIKRLFENLNSNLEIDGNSEITIECNPSSIDRDRLIAYKDCGINRLSLGIQSFNDLHLKNLGRLHDADTAIKAFELMRSIGFEDVSLDLIYGLPNQTIGEWSSDLKQALTLEPKHISAYNLIIEPGTPFGDLHAEGKLELPSEDTQSAMYDMLNELLQTAGIERYEISNFARKGYECHHNIKYWHLEPYLGLGPAAVSFDGVNRWKNREDLDSYLIALSENFAPPHEIEVLDPNKLLEETIMMSLRLSEGLSLNNLKERFQYNLHSDKKAAIESLISAGYITCDNDIIRLTSKALFISDEVILKLF